MTENRVIPTTWRENGVGFFGRTDAVEWRAYLLNSFKGTGISGSGIRGGRQKGGRALAEDLGIAGRMDYVGTPGLILGAAAFTGETAQNQELDGQEMLGWCVQAGYDVLRRSATAHRLIPYLRYERVNTQHSVASGFSEDPVNDLTVTSFGFAWKPDPQVVWKVGYQLHSNQAETGLNQWNLQIGWLF